MPMSSKKWLHGGLELCPCQARNCYMSRSRTMPMSSKKWLHGGRRSRTMPMSSKKLVTWRSRTMPMSSKKWLHRGLELCP